MRWNEYWKQRFAWKIYKEFREYREQLIEQSGNEVFEKAYEICTIQTIYEHLLCCLECLSESVCRNLVNEEMVLHGIYQEWLSFDDCADEEIKSFIDEEINHIVKNYKEAS